MSAQDELAERIAGRILVDLGAVVVDGDAADAAHNIAALVEELGYRKPRTITTAEEIRDLLALTIVVYDDMATGGPLQTYVVPDDGTVMFKDREPFHLMTFGGDYIDSEDMPLPLTVIYEPSA